MRTFPFPSIARTETSVFREVREITGREELEQFRRPMKTYRPSLSNW